MFFRSIVERKQDCTLVMISEFHQSLLQRTTTFFVESVLVSYHSTILSTIFMNVDKGKKATILISKYFEVKVLGQLNILAEGII